MDHLIEWIQTWGYFAVLLGAVIEGESIILTACVMAYLGYLSFPIVVAIAFFGTLFGDQALYYLGRGYGETILTRFPKMRPAADKAFMLLHRWDAKFILVFRFIYGIRIMSPIVIGAGGVSPWRFIPLNFIASIIWTAVSCTGGYFLGKIIHTIDFKVVERSVWAVSLIFLGGLGWVGYLAWRKLSLTVVESAAPERILLGEGAQSPDSGLPSSSPSASSSASSSSQKS